MLLQQIDSVEMPEGNIAMPVNWISKRSTYRFVSVCLVAEFFIEKYFLVTFLFDFEIKSLFQVPMLLTL